MSTTVIVFQEDCILAAMGKEGAVPVLTRAERVRLTGAGDAFAGWEQALLALGERWKEEPVRLVLPAGMSATRVLPIPYGKGKQLQKMAERETEGSFRNETADYSIVYRDQKNGVDLCAGGADKGILKQFADMCQRAGFTVDGITVPMEGYLHVLNRTDGYRTQTAIYLFFEEGSMTSILCENGRYLYSSRSRLFGEKGTLDFGTEIVRNISGILQFSAGNRRERNITQVYYAGCPAEDFEVSKEGMKELNLQVRPLEGDFRLPLPEGSEPSDWLPCIGALMWKNRKEKRIDLGRALEAEEQEQTVSGNLWKHMLAPGILLSVCLIIFGVLALVNWSQDRKIRGIQDWMESALVKDRYQEAEALRERLSRIEGSIAAAEQTSDNLSVYPDLSSEVLGRIQQAGGGGMELEISGYNAETGLLTFDADSREVIDVPSYILRMQQTGVFHKVDYTGYTYENGWYTLSLSCTMEGKRAGGRE